MASNQRKSNRKMSQKEAKIMAANVVAKYRAGSLKKGVATHALLLAWKAGKDCVQTRKVKHIAKFVPKAIETIRALGHTKEADPILCTRDHVLINGNNTTALFCELLELRKRDKSLSFVQLPELAYIEESDLPKDLFDRKQVLKFISIQMNLVTKHRNEQDQDDMKYVIIDDIADGIDARSDDYIESLAESYGKTVGGVRKTINSIYLNQQITEQNSNNHFYPWSASDISKVEEAVKSHYHKNDMGVGLASVPRCSIDERNDKIPEACGKAQFLAAQSNKWPVIVFYYKNHSDTLQPQKWIDHIEKQRFIRSEEGWFHYLILPHTHTTIDVFNDTECHRVCGPKKAVKAKKRVA